MYDGCEKKDAQFGPPTQKDIAAAAGVSQATVSMVLNKAETPFVPDGTKSAS